MGSLPSAQKPPQSTLELSSQPPYAGGNEPIGVDAVNLEGPELVPETTAKLGAVQTWWETLSSVLIKSMTVVRRGGRRYQVGWLGGLKGFGHSRLPIFRCAVAGNS